ncbi:unnamed protein product [Auanema sp. JU1783]|nr:unnamed protein product [Auanema sp. JU1783]
MAELPHIGKHCGASLCHRLDFLPVRCDACSGTYCIDHFTYDGHGCSQGYQKNVQVPVCPLCDKPVPTPKGVQPDFQVNEHIQNNCEKIAKPKIFTNKCSSKGCKKRELVPVTCPKCKLNFCLAHRHEKDHECGSVSSISSPGMAAMKRNAKSCSTEAREKQMSLDEQLARSLANMGNNSSGMDQDRQVAERMQWEEYERNRNRSRPSQTVSERCCIN